MSMIPELSCQDFWLSAIFGFAVGVLLWAVYFGLVTSFFIGDDDDTDPDSP